MATLEIRLRDIIIDPDRPVDLASLPEAEVIAWIKKTYGFLSSSIEVTIQGDIATITLPEEKAERAAEALRTYGRATRAAQRGEYARAIPLLKKVLEDLPAHAGARRDLAMAYLESGDKDAAKDYLVEALMLNPTDAWSHLLLANIYLKHERDLDRAERLFRSALELKPHDAIILTNYGTLMAQRGNTEQAAEFFERAIQADPLYPHPYHGLALVHMQEGKPADALATLDALFSTAKSTDIRSAPLYADARRLYLEINQQIAADTTAEAMDLVHQRRKALEQAGHVPIRIRQDEDLTVDATAQLAWRYARGYHLLRYRHKGPAITPHILAHELEHLALEMEARALGRNRSFGTTAATRDYATRSISADTARLRAGAMPADRVTDYINFIVNGLALQLYNMPIDMIVEQRLYDQNPLLHPSQLAYLHATLQESQRALDDTSIRSTSPRLIWQANVTLNAAYALFVDHLYTGRTAYAEPYRQYTLFAAAQRLFDLWQEAMRDFKSGDEYDLVDEYARILHLQRWYEWVPDEAAWVQPEESDLEPEAEGATNPELLQDKQSASVMYCLDALERFDRLGDDEIRAIAFEIALLGRSGLDYASADKKYTLNSIPGEHFTGLQLMCLMYVGFQRIDPTLDTGMDLADAYRTALSLRGSKH